MTELTKETKAEATHPIVKPALALEEVSAGKLNVTKLVHYGTPFEDLVSGAATAPPEGARVDIHFTGTLTGPISGTIEGVDYFNVRADGRSEVNVFAEITTDDGAKISFESQGVSVFREDGLARLRQGIKLTTSYDAYKWVNGLTFIEDGLVDSAAGLVSIAILK